MFENCKRLQEAVISDFRKLQRHHIGLENCEVQKKVVVDAYIQLCQRREYIANEIKITVGQVKVALTDILDNKLKSWKREQQLAANGLKTKLSLVPIRQWCKSLFKVILDTMIQIDASIDDIGTLKQQLKANDHHNMSLLSLQQMKTEIIQILTQLINRTFIVERQPIQVLKANTGFDARICLLVGGQHGIKLSASKVTVTIISEAQAGKMYTLLSAKPTCKSNVACQLVSRNVESKGMT